MNTKQLLLGNEAVARGAYEAGIQVVSSYPGTPSTEITENIAKHYADIRCEWAPNEKVALEVAIGASVSGARAMACMKHVGLNVAADPLFTAAYTGVNAGLVVVVADDPGMHSSQNEQDSRFYARSAHIPMLEPSDSAECAEFMREACRLSEAYDTPILLRLTTRVAHARSIVETGDPIGVGLKDYVRDIPKYVAIPALARRRHVFVEQRMDRMAADANASSLNRAELRDTKVGIVCSGVAYQYVREALPVASTYKIGLVHPLPIEAIRAFAAQVERLIVIEELEPVVEDALKAAGIPCEGKAHTGKQGELSARRVADAVAKALGNAPAPGVPGDDALPVRPPVLCPGCPHRATFHVLSKMKLHVFGDIGCYSLGAQAPQQAMDAILCMGASISMAHGAFLARGAEFAKQSVAVIGDSTFLHSGIGPLIDSVYNHGASTVLLLDNSTTGMTGHQNHPATGKDIRGNEAPNIVLEDLCTVIGARTRVVDPFDMKALESALREELAFEGTSVIICRRPCALLHAASAPYACDDEKCRMCGMCLRLGCPAIERAADKLRVNAALCNGCGLCAGVCAFAALNPKEART